MKVHACALVCLACAGLQTNPMLLHYYKLEQKARRDE